MGLAARQRTKALRRGLGRRVWRPHRSSTWRCADSRKGQRRALLFVLFRVQRAKQGTGQDGAVGEPGRNEARRKRQYTTRGFAGWQAAKRDPWQVGHSVWSWHRLGIGNYCITAILGYPVAALPRPMLAKDFGCGAAHMFRQVWNRFRAATDHPVLMHRYISSAGQWQTLDNITF